MANAQEAETDLKFAIRYSLAIYQPSLLPHSFDISPLRQWFAAKPGKVLYHPLRGDYGEHIGSLSMAKLRGRDVDHVQALQAAAEQLSLDIYLAVIEKELIDYNDDGYEAYLEACEEHEEDEDEDEDDSDIKSEPGEPEQSEVDVSYCIKKAVDLGGRTVSLPRFFDKEGLLDMGCFDRVEPTEEREEYENDPASLGGIYRYKVTVSFLFSFLVI